MKVKGILTKMKKDHLAEKLQQFLEENEINTCTSITEGQKEHEWFDSINRGGIKKCNNDFYSDLKMVEIEIKSILLPSTTYIQIPDIIEKLSKNDSIKNSWASLVASLSTPRNWN